MATSTYTVQPPAKRMRTDDHHEQQQALDLKLVCAGDVSVLVSSQLLVRATRSPAIEDIIAKLREENPHASAENPIELALKEDSPDDWKVVWNIIEKPLAEKPEGLTWANLQQVITLADKYELTSVIQALEAFILAALVLRPAMEDVYGAPFGHLRHNTEGVTIRLELPLLEVLHRAHMPKALKHMAPLFTQLLKEAMVVTGGRPWPSKTVGHRVVNIRQALKTYANGSSDKVTSVHVCGLITEQLLKLMEALP